MSDSGIGIDSFLQKLKNFEISRNKLHFQSYSLSPFESILNLFLEPNPNLLFRISVVGTNGKGSVSEFLATLLSKIGNVGLYTSPHLFSFTERIKVNGIPISKDWINKWMVSLPTEKRTKLQTLSYFEFLTLLAFVYFREFKTSYEVFEAGLGGRLDATKTSQPDFVVLTKIDLDHMEILGNSKDEILAEKLGIVANSTKILFFMKQEGINLKKIKTILNNKYGVNPYIIGFDEEIEQYTDYLSFNYQYSIFILKKLVTEKYLEFYFQRVLEEMKIAPRPQGRIEILKKSPPMIYDVAHNPSALSFFLKSIMNLYPGTKWNCMIGTLPDKDTASMLQILVENEYIESIFQIVSSPFSNETLPTHKIYPIELYDISKKLQEKNPLLIVGSFRLRELLE
jgi:dihydrofolate synthase / folylpolyglutamate synthase